MNGTLGVGVVGAGAIGIRGALSHLSQPYRISLAAICDPVPGRAEAAAKRFGVAAHYLSYEELLADPRVDMVTLCSPIGLHCEQGLQAIAAGKHVHFNKTMATTVADADILIARAADKGIKLVASPGQMIYPYNQRLRRLILEGALGKLAWAIAGTAGVGDYHLTEEFRTGQDILTDVDPTWYFKKPGGGPQYDVTVYCLHTLTGILGPARRVTALSGLQLADREYRGQKIACEADDTTILLLDFGESFFAVVYACVAGGGFTHRFQPNIYGANGAIIGTRFGERNMRKPNEFPPHVTAAHAALPEFHVFADMMQLVDWVREGRPALASTDQARHVIEIIEAGYRAAATGQAQQLRTSFAPLPLAALAVC
jgi:predicted dehydrogenase